LERPAQSSDETVIRILADGLLQIVGSSKTVVTVTKRGKQATLDVSVEVNIEPNELSIANAGPNKIVKTGAKVKFSGLKRRDLEGEALLYQWSQVCASKVSPLDANGLEVTVQAPPVTRKTIVSVPAEGDRWEEGRFGVGLCRCDGGAAARNTSDRAHGPYGCQRLPMV